MISNGSGFLNSWIDFDGNGKFDQSEQIFTDQIVMQGQNYFNFSVPLNAKSGATFCRFRVNSLGGLPPTGYSENGEVEDYQVKIWDNLSGPQPGNLKICG